MKQVELYARVRHAVLIEGISERAAAALCAGVCAIVVGALTSVVISGITSGSLGQGLKAGLITAVSSIAFNIVGDLTAHG